MGEQQPTKQEHLETLYQITRQINSSLDLGVVLNEVMDRVIEVTGAKRGLLMLRGDEGELEFKVARGINQKDLEDPEFQVSYTVVSEVESKKEPLLTDNAQYDERVKKGLSIVSLQLRSILCVPILVRDTLTGVVYVDNQLRDGAFNEEHRYLLAAFASQAGVAIENARLYQVAVEKGRMEQELRMAHDVQLSLLPREIPTVPGYELAADWESAREVAGDFYDFIPLSDGKLGVLIADVSDKGVSAALFMAVSRSMIRSNAILTEQPDEMLRQANQLILSDAQSGMFVTVYYVVLEAGGKLQCVNAGHNLPLWYHARTGEHEFLPKGGRALGWFEDLPVETVEIQLEPGDVLVLYTDGVSEAENLQQDYFGEDRLVEVVRRAAGQSAQGVLDAINAAIKAFVGKAPPFDDHTLVVLRYVG